jgi:hypothetical protein
LQEIAMLPTPVAETPSPAAAATKVRDQRGRFVAGNPGGTGNPFARQVAALRKAFLESVTPEDIAAVVAALLARAKEGDVAAAKLVLTYAVGKPEATVDPDRLDLDEWQTFKDGAGMMNELPRLVLQPEPDMSLEVLRTARPLMTREYIQFISDYEKDPSAARLRAAKRSPSPVGSDGRRSRQAPPSPNRPNGAGGISPQRTHTGAQKR